MSLSEIWKRVIESIKTLSARFKYRNPSSWPYQRLAPAACKLKIRSLPGLPLHIDWKNYLVYENNLDLRHTIDWHASENPAVKWPDAFYSKINYRPGNPYGDVRINWELNRLQFLPVMAMSDENLAKRILADWLDKNTYLHGPAYIASMEVALRWISIYWAICKFKTPVQPGFKKNVIGFAYASGCFIENKLSTHSSAGNHLILEAVGLFWVGKALEDDQRAKKWINQARQILWQQIPLQINQDGSNQEQTFWYLGFVVDALLHYLLIEDRDSIPQDVLNRIESALEFINLMTLPDGDYFDYGDRDDGYVFRMSSGYEEPPFNALLNVGSLFFKNDHWYRGTPNALEHFAFWGGNNSGEHKKPVSLHESSGLMSEVPTIRQFSDGGMTLMRWGKGKILFRHSRLGLGNTCGHGHADALSVLIFWGNKPVLIDPGSGQYNGLQRVRNFFRSTIAHNTVEIEGRNQAEILGPFLWGKSYHVGVSPIQSTSLLECKAYHDGYQGLFTTRHIRHIKWFAPNKIQITDSFTNPKSLAIKCMLHLGEINKIHESSGCVEADFGEFSLLLTTPHGMKVDVFYGSQSPYMGWRTIKYGHIVPTHSIMVSGEIPKNASCRWVLSFKEHKA